MASRTPYPQDHATHVPILTGLGKTFPHTKKVLEFGGGDFSTRVFLDQRVFPNLQWLDTIEPEGEWLTKLKAQWGDNPRWDTFENEQLNFSGYDLILIDNGPYEHKIETIRQIVREFAGIIVVHDTEVEAYKNEIKNLSYRYDFQMYNPETSVGVPVHRNLPIAHIERQVSKKMNEIAVDDIEGWIQYFQSVERL